MKESKKNNEEESIEITENKTEKQMMAMLIQSFNTMAKMAEGIVSVQDVIITMCMLESAEKDKKLKECIEIVKTSRNKLKKQ